MCVAGVAIGNDAMHGHEPYAEFLFRISGFLGWYYLSLSAMNGLAALYLWRKGGGTKLFRVAGFQLTTVHLWLAVALLFMLMSPIAMSGSEYWIGLISFSDGAKNAMDAVMGPVVYTVGTMARPIRRR